MNEDNIENISDQQDQGSVQSGVTVNDHNESANTFNADDYVHKSRVNDLVHQRTKEAAVKAAEKARAELLAERDREKNTTGMGGMHAPDENKILQMLQDELDKREQHRREAYEKESYAKTVDDLANSFMGKITAAKETYPDLIKRQDEIAELALLVPYINETSEVAGISQHLLDNEGAFANLLVLSHQSPARVRAALKKIEASIKTNNDALNREYPNAPLSQPNPSVTTMDNGSSSIEALKRQPWLRG